MPIFSAFYARVIRWSRSRNSHGTKMLIVPWYHVPVAASLAIVTVLIGASVIASLIATRKKST